MPKKKLSGMAFVGLLYSTSLIFLVINVIQVFHIDLHPKKRLKSSVHYAASLDKNRAEPLNITFTFPKIDLTQNRKIRDKYREWSQRPEKTWP